MEESNLRAHSLRVLMPLEEGGQNALQLRSIDLPGNFLRSDSGGVFFQINIVGSEDGDIVSVECVYIFPFEVVAVGGWQRHEAQTSGQVSYGGES